MAYGPLCQCAFMSYGPRIQQKAPPIKENRQLWDKLTPFVSPNGAEPPPPGAFTLMSFDIEEAKSDPVHAARSMALTEPCTVFGSSQYTDGQVHDGHKSVQEQHLCLYYAKGKWFIKAINGVTYLESMTLHPWLRDGEGRPPKRYTSTAGKKTEAIQSMDLKRRLSREVCVFRLGESDRRFWVAGPLPLKEGEFEEDGGERKKERGERGERHEAKGRGEKERGRSRSRSRRRRR
uniref:Uncharacterized protein n=1 Tax=Alexandrium catenella TaxID=2925 RepID=A0A7S1RMQ7_ALECA|mmetsp:Transcript_65264/g.173977  ORF Transcript_65264/g.173977 Transcript_65264/m.173977 type:complete len:234 (+) Transcript_65264:97-798(+)